MLSLCTWTEWHLSSPCPAVRWPLLLRFVAVQVFEGFQFLDERFVLVLQHGHAVLQTFDVLLFLPATLASCLPVWHRDHVSAHGVTFTCMAKSFQPTKRFVLDVKKKEKKSQQCNPTLATVCPLSHPGMLALEVSHKKVNLKIHTHCTCFS